jgi:hypothetical protein
MKLFKIILRSPVYSLVKHLQALVQPLGYNVHVSLMVDVLGLYREGFDFEYQRRHRLTSGSLGFPHSLELLQGQCLF